MSTLPLDPGSDGLDTVTVGSDPPPLPVEVIRSSRRVKTVSARIVDGVVRVRIPAWMTAADEHRYVSDIVARIERSRRCGRVDLERRAAELAERYDLPRPCSITWSARQRFRWGSCTPATGHIRISDRLAAVPGWVLDHVIVHELAHLLEPDHSSAFHELVARYPLSERATGYLLALQDQIAEPPAA